MEEEDTVRLHLQYPSPLSNILLTLVIDVGVASLIIKGKVKVKQGVELREFASTGVTFTDGSEMEADVVIFA